MEGAQQVRLDDNAALFLHFSPFLFFCLVAGYSVVTLSGNWLISSFLSILIQFYSYLLPYLLTTCYSLAPQSTSSFHITNDSVSCKEHGQVSAMITKICNSPFPL